MNTNRVARLTSPRNFSTVCTETGETTTYTLPAGSPVFAQNLIERPTMMGGGFNATVTDINTGATITAVVR